MARLRMFAEIIGAAGLALSAPAAYYTVTRAFGSTALALWLSNLLFAGNQIHYVHLRIHSSRVVSIRAKLAQGWTFAFGQLMMLLVLIVVCRDRLMPWHVLAAFIPTLLRGYIYFFRPPRTLVVRRLGWSELSQSVCFCVLFVAAFALAP